MTNQMKEIANAIYELTINPTATPSNWDNLAEDIQVAITQRDEEHLYDLLKINQKYFATLDDPDDKIDVAEPEVCIVTKVQ